MNKEEKSKKLSYSFNSYDLSQLPTKQFYSISLICFKKNEICISGTYTGGDFTKSPRIFVKYLISPWFLGISGKSWTYIKNLDTCVKPFLGDFTACNYPVKSLPMGGAQKLKQNGSQICFYGFLLRFVVRTKI